MKANFSVVSMGPIKYTERLWQAISYARTCVRRRGFMVDGQWHKLRRPLTIYRLTSAAGLKPDESNDAVTTIP